MSRDCCRSLPFRTGRGGGPKFFLNWLTFARSPISSRSLNYTLVLIFGPPLLIFTGGSQLSHKRRLETSKKLSDKTKKTEEKQDKLR